MNQITGVPNKSVYGKKYYLLKFTKCPAVIVEVGFLTNETDRKRMTSEQGQKQIAEALVKGIDRYLKEVLNHP
ncbi:N-acetylmuramoyl-L-alanine amidase [Paenibacillus larvae]|nr:N-acetylmuramoyl-L-alanine amidase [Paenibacillus larvae]MDT2294654.1 N-acetylmuramoyl-L-alanine amidase [Paenibacillus larvae]